MADLGTPVACFTPPPMPGPQALQGRFCRLERLAALHAAGLQTAYAGHDALWDYMPYGPFADVAGYAAWAQAMAGKPDPFFYAILVEGQPLGVLSLLRIAPQAGSIELGHICLSPPLQGTPAATEAFALAVGWAFAAGYRRFEWKCDALNLASRRAAERLGLSYEGVFRQALVVKGRNRDTAWFAAIDSEWPVLQAAYETWLAPENFDAAGGQRQRLSEMTRPVLVVRDPALTGA